VLAQAAGLALLSALSPTALLIAAVYLGSARPGLTSFFYLAGAVLMSIVMGVVVLRAFNSWLRANGRTVLAGVLVAVGGIMVSDGIYGLITRSG
jgi:hypothetical protein